MLVVLANSPVLVPAAVAVALHFVLRLLPLISDRANKRAVRLARAKNST